MGLELSFEQKKQKLITTLNNHFGYYNQLAEIETISNDDIVKIINLYEQEASKDGEDPWHYLYFDDLIIMQKCVYDVIKDMSQYSNITEKLEELYEHELNRRLKRTVYEYGEATDKTYQQSYAKMAKYSLTLADMSQRKIQRILNQESDIKDVVQLEQLISNYEKIKSDFDEAEILLPESYENTVAIAKVKLNEFNAMQDKKQADNISIETEKEKRIDLIRNEINNIKDRITTIRNSINLGQVYVQRVREQYPIIYQNYMASLKLLQSYSPNNSTYSTTTNLEDYLQIELEMYKRVLSSFEEYAQVNFEKKEVNKEEHEDRKTLIIEVLNLVNNISDFDNGFSLADLAAQFDEDSSYYSIEKLQQLKNQYLEMIQSKKTFKEDSKEKMVQGDRNTLIIEILSLMNKHRELDTAPSLPDVIKQLSTRNIEELEKIRNDYLPLNKNKVNSQSNEMKIDAMIEAMANGELDTNGEPIIETENQNSNVRIMGFTAFKLLALVSFAFSGLILILGTIAIAFMK